MDFLGTAILRNLHLRKFTGVHLQGTSWHDRGLQGNPHQFLCNKRTLAVARLQKLDHHSYS